MPSRISFSVEDEQKVMAALESFSLRDRCLIVFGLNTGYRATELGSVTIGQVWDGTRVRPEVTVQRCALKGGRGVRRAGVRSRTVPINGAARGALHEYIRWREQQSLGPLAPQAALFLSPQTGTGLTRWRLNQLVHLVVAAAGLSDSSRFGTHSLRKTFAMKVHLAGGRDINLTRAAMGHRHLSTTQAYLEVDAEEVRGAILAIGD